MPWLRSIFGFSVPRTHVGRLVPSKGRVIIRSASSRVSWRTTAPQKRQAHRSVHARRVRVSALKHTETSAARKHHHRKASKHARHTHTHPSAIIAPHAATQRQRKPKVMATQISVDLHPPTVKTVRPRSVVQASNKTSFQPYLLQNSRRAPQSATVRSTEAHRTWGNFPVFHTLWHVLTKPITLPHLLQSSGRPGVRIERVTKEGPKVPARTTKVESEQRSGVLEPSKKTSAPIRIERVLKQEPSRSTPMKEQVRAAQDVGSLLKEQAKDQQRQREETERIVTLVVRAPARCGGITGFLKSINNIGMGKLRVLFIQNLSMMLGAGLPLIDALQTLQLEIRQRSMRKVVGSIRAGVENGHPLWFAMESQYLFSPYEIALVRVGEEAGNLARNMGYLAVQQEKDRSLRQKVKMATIYPSIVLVLMFIVVAGLGMFVLPNLVQVLRSLNVELPLMTRIVIGATDFFEEQGMTVIPLTAAAMVVLGLLMKFTPLRVVGQWLVFQLPGIGSLAKEATIARFGVVLGGLLEAGVPLVESLQSLEEVTTIVSYRRLYRKLVERIAIGDSFATCFHDMPRSWRLIPIAVQQLVITGELSGSLAKTFQTIADIYDKKAEETAKKLPVILEPILLLLIGGLVGAIALSVIMPIYSAVGNVANG